MVNIAINGFGRIGRLFLRAALPFKELNITAINDLGDASTLAHLFRYDSVHKEFKGEVGYSDNELVIDGRHIKLFSERDPEKLPWLDLGIDIVVESTGRFTSRELAQKHILAGAKRVLISAPSPDPDFTIIKGVNEHLYNPEEHRIISNGSCTTNCLAPIVKVLDDNYGVMRGFMVTVHAYTADQRLVDAAHHDLRRARSAALSIVPTTTGAAKTVTKVLPHLQGRLDGMAMRVPVADGSIVDFVVDVGKDVTREDVLALFSSVSRHELKGIIEYADSPLVSADIVGNPHSAIFDAPLTRVIDNRLLEVIAWYDNEWGYSNRLVDVAKLL